MADRNWVADKFLDMYNNDARYSADDLIEYLRQNINIIARDFGVNCNFNDDTLWSIIQRLSLLVQAKISTADKKIYFSNFTDTTGKNVKEIVVKDDTENYANLIRSGSVIDISFKDITNFRIFLDLKDGGLFIREFKKIKISDIDTCSSGTYYLGDMSLLSKRKWSRDKMLKRKFDQSIDEDKLENVIICDRFDPIDNSSTLQNFKMMHKNKIQELSQYKTEEEISLIKEYFGTEARVPHFHFGTKSYALASRRGSQLAITTSNLARYYNDLANAIATNQDSPIRKIDIGIPKDVLLEKKDQKNFAIAIKKILEFLEQKYNKQAKAYIDTFYAMIYEKFRNNNGNGGDGYKIIGSTIDLLDKLSSFLSPNDQVLIAGAIQDVIIGNDSLLKVKESSYEDGPTTR